MGFSLKRSYLGQREAARIANTARATLALVTRAIRGASPGVPNGNIQDLVTCSTLQGIRVLNGGATNSDQLELVYQAGVVGSVWMTYNRDAAFIAVHDGSMFAAGDLVVVSNMDQGHLLRVRSVTPFGVGHLLDLDSAASGMCGGAAAFPTGNYPPGSLVIKVRLARFFVSGGILMMDTDLDGAGAAEPIANGVEDMQIAVAVDTSGDGLLQEVPNAADEWFYNFAGDANPPAMTATPWRALRVTMTVSSLAKGEATAMSARPAAEDRTAGTADALRRRTVRTMIELRNSAASP
jgi:hypothetical protein